MRLSCFQYACSSLFVLVLSAVPLLGQEEPVRFAQEIRPLLSSNCFHCHGPNEESREADLRLDTHDGAFAKLDDYQIIVPGKPEESELFRRISSSEADERMPPADSEHELSQEEIELFRKWIEQGAAWQEHWSFTTPQRPELPEVQRSDWGVNPIDRFILAKLESKELSPTTPADRRTLIRRVTFDLTGLPPRLEDVRAFVDDTSPDAYEQVVDRLFNSEHYGEHMGRYWLDAARYADTHGLHLDNYREMWLYRDWVINAFNANMPFDQFMIEQLAGDLLPDATVQQQVASGFNRCHVTTNEGGSIAEEVYVRNVVDRVSTVGTVCLGLTVGCAVCHDHKFDPITQKEFYQLFAFFNNLDGPSMDGNVKDPAPTLRVPTAEQEASFAKIAEQMNSIKPLEDERRQAIEPKFQDWLAKLEPNTGNEQLEGDPQSKEGLSLHCNFDEGTGEAIANSTDPKHPGKTIGSPLWVEGKNGGGVKITKEGYVDLGNQVGNFKKEQSFSIGIWVKCASGSAGTVLAKMDTKNNMRGYELSVEGSHVVATLNKRSPGYVVKIKTKESIIEHDKWHHLFVTYDGSILASGVRLFVDGKPQLTTVLTDSLKVKGDFHNSKPILLGRREDGSALVGASIDELRIYGRLLTDSDIQAIYLADEMKSALTSPPAEWSPEQLEMLRQLYFIRKDPNYGQLSTQLITLQQQQKLEETLVPTTLIFRERKEPKEAFILKRGEYDQKGEKVERETPAFLPPLDENLSRDRLGLAKWLLSVEHPLTSRVAVNRFWQQVFGIGLAETSEDFGSQGTPPSHPMLIDWLAVEFRESGWDVNALMKQLVMSSTYRQSSQTTPMLTQRDPRNRLLARGPRFRLDAEMVRDQTLSISGLLIKQVGGPSVKPPQPAGLWKAVGYSGSNTVEFKQDEGQDKTCRRSLYTFWKRTSPPPQMNTLDAPSRESCSVRRERTNTPLQALLLMNDPQYVEAARHFAERIIKENSAERIIKTNSAERILHEADATPRERIQWAFEEATLRAPSDIETEGLLTAQAGFQTDYEANPEAAKQLIAVGDSSPDDSINPVELATWTMVANVLLNLDEVVTKE